MNGLPVLISGTSSGIGRACAVLLSKNGFRVFAGVRNKSDGVILQKNALGKIIPLLSDVLDPISIKNATNEVSNETGGKLFALINNAGVVLGGSLETLPLDEIRKLFEVNVIAVFAVTIAFIPFSRKGLGGRIINMGSILGILSLLDLSAPATSKHVLETITDFLCLELDPLINSVSIIELGNVDNQIWGKSSSLFNEIISQAEDEVSQLYPSSNIPRCL